MKYRAADLRGFLFVGPSVIFLFALIIYPLLTIIPQSFQAYDHHQFHWVGLAQYQRLLSDGLFWTSLRLTVVFTVGTVALHQIFGWIIASLLNGKWRHHKFRNFMRGLILVPWILSAPASALLWRLLYYSRGVLTYLGQALFGVHIGFLTDPKLALVSILIVFMWNFYPLYMLLILGRLQSIPESLYEAARVDGANRVQSFWHITIPQTAQLVMTMILIDFITTFVQFALVWTMTKGGPLRSTYLVSFYLYERGFLASKFGYASAVSVVVAIVISIFLFLNLRFFREGGNET